MSEKLRLYPSNAQNVVFCARPELTSLNVRAIKPSGLPPTVPFPPGLERQLVREGGLVSARGTKGTALQAMASNEDSRLVAVGWDGTSVRGTPRESLTFFSSLGESIPPRCGPDAARPAGTGDT